MGADRLPSFGDELRRLRLLAGLTQEELAIKAGLTSKAISKLERGERRHPYPDTVRRLASALRLDAETNGAFVAAAHSPGQTDRQEHSTALAPPLTAPVGGFLGAMPVGPLIGRQAELARVSRVTEEVRSGAGRFVLLAGEPGVGKTRLAQEAALALERRAFLVLTGRCYEPERSAPFSPFFEALAMAQWGSPPGLRAAIPTRWPDLGRLLPDWTVPFPPSSPTADEPQRLLRAVTGFLEALSSGRPLAVILDDLHWADESSLRLVQYIARHTRNRRILLIGTYRDVDVQPDHPLARALADLDREGLVEQISVPDLDEAETAQLIDVVIGRAEPAIAGWVQGRTDGNPLFTRELVRNLIDRGALVQRRGQWGWGDLARAEVPASVRAVIGQRVARLTPGTRELLRQASVLGEAFGFDLLVAVGGWSEETAEAAVEEAAASGLLRGVGGDDYAFDHALTRDALYVELGERRRRRLHRAAGEVLEGRPEADRVRIAAELARHFLEGRVPERALHWATVAGDRAEALFAHPEAERHYRQALALARELADGPRTARLQEKLGALLTIVGRYDEALAILERAVEAYVATGETERLAATLAPLLWAHSMRGTPAQGIRQIEPLLPLLELARPSPALALLHVKLATIFHFVSRYDKQLRAGERAAQLAARVGDDRVLAEAEDVRGYALCLLGRIEEGLEILERARALAESTDHPVALSNILGHLALTHLFHGSFAAAGREAEGAVAAARRLGDPQLVMIWKPLIGMHRTLVGDWRDARRQIVEATPADEGNALPYPLFELGWLELLEGAWNRSAHLLELGARIAERSGHLQSLRYAAHFLAQLDVLSGNPDRAIARLTPLLDRPGLEEQDVTFLLPCIAWAHLERGELDRAQELAVGAVERAQRQHHLLARVVGLRVLGMALGKRERWVEAERVLEEGRGLAHSLPFPYAEARALREQGILDQRTGKPERAGERLTEALTIFARLGARRDVEQTERLLRNLAEGEARIQG